MTLQPGEYNDRKWADPPRFELVDQTIAITPGAQLGLVDQQFGEGPTLAATVVAVEPAADRADERLVVDTPRGRLALTRRYGWIGERQGESVKLRAGRSEIRATEVASGQTRRIQVVVPGTPR